VQVPNPGSLPPHAARIIFECPVLSTRLAVHSNVPLPVLCVVQHVLSVALRRLRVSSHLSGSVVARVYSRLYLHLAHKDCASCVSRTSRGTVVRRLPPLHRGAVPKCCAAVRCLAAAPCRSVVLFLAAVPRRGTSPRRGTAPPHAPAVCGTVPPLLQAVARCEHVVHSKSLMRLRTRPEPHWDLDMLQIHFAVSKYLG
jgi:hypothetical protein